MGSALFFVRLARAFAWLVIYQLIAIIAYWHLPASWQSASIVFLLILAVITLAVLKFLEPLKIDPAFLDAAEPVSSPNGESKL